MYRSVSPELYPGVGLSSTTVASGLPGASPYPNSAGPLFHEVSLKEGVIQFVPWSVPVSRYFQTDPVETRKSIAALAGVATRNNPRNNPAMRDRTRARINGFILKL